LCDVHSAHWYLAVICFAGLREPVVSSQKMAQREPSTTAAVSHYILL